MPARYDPKLGKVVYGEDELGNPITDSEGLSPLGESGQKFSLDDELESPVLTQARQQAEQDEAALQKVAATGLEDTRNFVDGGIVGDLVKAPFDVAAGLGTDAVDLVLGVADVARATASSAGLGDFGWDQVFDDRDNPLTQARRNSVGNYNTKLGEMIGTTGRIASFFIGGKAIYAAPKLVSKLGALGRLVNSVPKLLPGASATYRSAATAQRLAKGAAAANKASKGTKAFKIAAKNPYLTTTFKDIANAPEVAGWWKSSVNSFRAVKGMGKAKINPKNMAETLAMDMFASFNVFGEGNDGMDETIFDMFDDMGVELPEVLLQSPLDSGVSRKLKGVADGTLFSFIGGGLVDLWRIGKFRRAFDAASDAEKVEIRKAFLDSYEELGEGVGNMLTRIGPAPASQLDSLWGGQPLQPSFFDRSTDPYVPSTGFNRPFVEGPGNTFADEIGVTTANGRIADPFDTRGVLARLEDVRKQNDSYELALTKAQLEASPIEEVNVRVETGLARTSPPQRALPDQAGKVRVRVEEPTVSPGGIADAVDQSVANGVPPEQIVRDVQRLMPTKNVDLIEYATMNPPRMNSVGMIRASDQIWNDYILKKGMEEGWVRLDENFNPIFIRSAAKEADIAGLAQEQAKALDELQQIRDFEMFADSRPKGDAADLDARLKERQPSNYPASETMPVRDPAALAAQADALNAAKNEEALSEQEFARLAQEVTAEDPDQLIRDQLRVDPLQADESVTVAKAETGRGWEVYDVDGELYPNGRFTTKRAAEKFAAKERKALRDELSKRAQQVANDDAGEVIEYATNDFARDSSLTGKVALTKNQINELTRYPNFKPIFEQFGVNKQTYEFTQGDMADVASGARALLQTGEIKGPRARVLNNLIEKFDTAVRELEPRVRLQRQSQRLINGTKRVLNHGDYCA